MARRYATCPAQRVSVSPAPLLPTSLPPSARCPANSDAAHNSPMSPPPPSAAAPPPPLAPPPHRPQRFLASPPHARSPYPHTPRIPSPLRSAPFPTSSSTPPHPPSPALLLRSTPPPPGSALHFLRPFPRYRSHTQSANPPSPLTRC